jgi:hypothetical protein
MRAVVRDGLVAGAIAAVASGLPSTLHGLLVTGRPLEPTLAAGSLVAPRETRPVALAAAAVPVHLAVSLGWAVVLSRALPTRHTVVAGATAGLAIAALDLGVVGRRLPRIRALSAWPQTLDHLAYGAVAGAVIARRRASSPSRSRRAGGRSSRG